MSDSKDSSPFDESKMEWTREKTLLLISEYQKRPGLWDMTHPDYRKREVKKELATEVSQRIDNGILPVVEVEKKFHTLRTQYHREINRMKRNEDTPRTYYSKWFAFKHLQFLSSPKAMRTGSKVPLQVQVKKDKPEKPSTTTKYIIKAAPEGGTAEVVPVSVTTSTSGSAKPLTTVSTNYLTVRKPATATVSFETNGSSGAVQKRDGTLTSPSTRSRDLEKLIEETTKDGEPEDTKSKIVIKEITLPMHNQSQNNYSTINETDIDDHQMLHSEHMTASESQSVLTDDENMSYHTGRIIKIHTSPRRDTTNYGDGYYEEEQSPPPKRMYFETTSTPAVTASVVKPQTQQTRNTPDDYSTYGEYVANEMRLITSREILTTLKHKINVAIYEASMAELQKHT